MPSQRRKEQASGFNLSSSDRRKSTDFIMRVAKQKCGICLNEMNQDQKTSFSCSHQFCEDCALSWWKQKDHCPYCRKPIEFYQDCNGNMKFRDQISEGGSIHQSEFVMECLQCWGDIQVDRQQYYICRICRSGYMHKKCIPYKIQIWTCQECSKNENEKCLQMIPFNKIIFAELRRKYKKLKKGKQLNPLKQKNK